MGDENPIRTLGDYSRPSHEGYRNTIELPKGNNVVPLRSDTKTDAHSTDYGPRIQINTSRTFLKLRTIDQLAGGKLCDLNTEESWKILEDLALYDNESWNDPMDFAKPVKAIALPQDVPNARLSKFEADFKQQQSEMTNTIDNVLKAITDRIAGTLSSDTVKNPKLGTYPVLSARVVRFIRGTDEVSYKMPHKIEQYDSTSSGHNLQKEGSSLYTDELKKSRKQEGKAGNTGYKAKDNGRRPGKQEEPKALVTLDGDGVDWTGHAEDEQENFALMAHSNSGSNTEKLLAKAIKEKEELKTKLENFQSSSKGLSKLLNSQMSTRDKSGLGYGKQIHEGVLSYEKEVLKSVFDSRSSDVEDSLVNDRFANVKEIHAVPPLMTRIYMPSKPDFGINESKFTYGPKLSKTSESDAKTSDTASFSKSKVWSDAPIIEEYELDSDDEYVIEPSKEQKKPSFAFVNTVKHVKTPRETVKE
ncbi:hypothetical protein Tco_0003016 [Tanacetum coccineum]